MIDRGAIHNTAVIIYGSLAGITIVVVLGVRNGAHVASTPSGLTFWIVILKPRPAAVVDIRAFYLYAVVFSR